MKKIKIENPCHESWNGMTSVSGGRFCDLCSKKVFDLTDKTDQEVDEIFSSNKDNHICTRIQKSRIIVNQARHNNISFSLAKSVVSVLLLATFTPNLKAQISSDTVKTKEIMDVIVVGISVPINDSDESPFQKTVYKKINGWVKSKQNEREANAQINLVNLSTLYQITTNNQGNFNFSLPEDELRNNSIFISRRKNDLNKIYYNVVPSQKLENIHLEWDEEYSSVLNPKNIAKKETYFVDGEEVSLSEFRDAISDTNNIEYFYVPFVFSSILKPLEKQTGFYIAFSKQ